MLNTQTIDPDIPDKPIHSEAIQIFFEKENINRVKLPRKNAARIAPFSILGDSPNHSLTKTGPIAYPIPLEENMIPTAIDTAAGSDHNRLANNGINVIIPPLMAIPDFNKVRARTIGREIR